MVVARRVGVVLRLGSVGDDENLHPLEKRVARPEPVPVVPFDLIERLANRNAAFLQLDMDDGQSVHQHGHVVTEVVLALLFLVLVDDLKPIVVDVFGVEDHQVGVVMVVKLEIKPALFLKFGGLLLDVVFLVGENLFVEPLPFLVREWPVMERNMVQLLHLNTQVGNQIVFARQRLQVFVALRLQRLDELLLQLRLRFVSAAPDLKVRHILVHHRELRQLRQLVIVHLRRLPELHQFLQPTRKLLPPRRNLLVKGSDDGRKGV